MFCLLLPALAADWLPEDRLFSLPLADTRSPLSTVTLKWFPDGSGPGVDATIATDFPIVLVHLPVQVDMEVGLAAGSFLGFSPGGEFTFDLYTFDGLIALPLDVRWKQFSSRLQWSHVSAHYGDGVRKMGNKPENPGSWSREYWEWQVGGQWGPVRPYVGVRLIAHEVRDDAPPWAFQVGLDAVSPWKIGPCGGANLWLAAEDAWVPAVDVLAGACLTGGQHRLRVSFALRNAPEDTGKLQGKREEYMGIQLGFDESGNLLRWALPEK